MTYLNDPFENHKHDLTHRLSASREKTTKVKRDGHARQQVYTQHGHVPGTHMQWWWNVSGSLWVCNRTK